MTRLSSSRLLVLLGVVGNAYADCTPPTGVVADLVTAITQIGTSSQNVSNLVQGYDVSTGIDGGLIIQYAELDIENAVESAIKYAQQITEPTDCDQEAVVSATKGVAPDIVSCLQALGDRFDDLASIGLNTVVNADLESLLRDTYSLESSSYELMTCDYLPEMFTLFDQINNAFAGAFEAYGITEDGAPPTKPDCPVITTTTTQAISTTTAAAAGTTTAEAATTSTSPATPVYTIPSIPGCADPTGIVAALATNLANIQQECDVVTSDLKGYDPSTGLVGGLAIQNDVTTLELLLNTADQNAQQVEDPTECEVKLIIASIQAMVPRVSDLMDALLTDGPVLISVNSLLQTLMQQDIRNLWQKTAAMEQTAYDKMPDCASALEAQPYIDEITSIFQKGISTFQVTPVADPPQIPPQCEPGAATTSAASAGTSAVATTNEASEATTTESSGSTTSIAAVTSESASATGTASVTSEPADKTTTIAATSASAEPTTTSPVTTGLPVCTPVDCSSYSPTGSISDLITALGKLGDDSAQTGDLVNAFSASQGLLAALDIQTSYADIEQDVKDAVNAANGISPPASECESEAVYSAVKASASKIASVLQALSAKSADLIDVGTLQIVQNDLNGLSSYTEQLESSAYEKFPCQFASQLEAQFEIINSAFNTANQAYQLGAISFPTAPSDCPAASSSTCVPAPTGTVTAISSGAASEAVTSGTATSGAITSGTTTAGAITSGSAASGTVNSGTVTSGAVVVSSGIRTSGAPVSGANSVESTVTISEPCPSITSEPVVTATVTLTEGTSTITITNCGCSRTSQSGSTHSVCTGSHSGGVTTVTIPCHECTAAPEPITTSTVTDYVVITKTRSNGEIYTTGVPEGNSGNGVSGSNGGNGGNNGNGSNGGSGENPPAQVSEQNPGVNQSNGGATRGVILSAVIGLFLAALLL